MPDLLSALLGLAVSRRKVDVKEIPVADIVPNPNQPREWFDERALEELSMSIKEFGVIQPVIVREKFLKYELVVGERRLRASRMAGLETVPAVVRRLSDDESLALALIENLQREDLNPVEEAKVYLRLVRDLKLSQRRIAEHIGKSPHVVSKHIALLRLPAAVQKGLTHEDITRGHAFALLRLKDEELQTRALKTIREKNLSVKQTETLVERMLRGQTAVKGRTLKEDPHDPQKAYEVVEAIKTFVMQMKKSSLSDLPVQADVADAAQAGSSGNGEQKALTVPLPAGRHGIRMRKIERKDCVELRIVVKK